MKKILAVTPLFIVLLAAWFFIGSTELQKESKIPLVRSNPMNPASIITNNRSNINFNNVNLFSVTGKNNIQSTFKKSTSLKLDKNALKNIFDAKEKSIVFTIPQGDAAPLELELIEQKVFSDEADFYAITSLDSKTRTTYTPGISYTGIVKGKEHSLASITIFDNLVMGLVSDETGNYVLGSVKDENNNNTDNYIFYNDADLKALNNFKCAVEGRESELTKHGTSLQNDNHGSNFNNTDARLAVKIYFEADFRLYQDMGSNQTTLMNFVQGMFAQVKTIYTAESIPIEISRVAWWTSTDPYAGYSGNQSIEILQKFGENTKDNFQGNLAQLLSSRQTGGGGIAWINTLCTPYQPNDKAGRYSFCFIDPDYSIYPTYSWTVGVVAHEFGHNFGSQHTHACVWPVFGSGFLGAIDSCYTAEEGCFPNSAVHGIPNGTIMSYCHLDGSINFSRGFGPLPGDTIYLRYQQAGCLYGTTNSSEAPVVYDLKQNFPNPFNPSTTIRFVLPVDAVVHLKVYNISGKEVANLINSVAYAPGFYDYTFNTSIYNLPSGTYFYKLTALSGSGDNLFTQVKKMILIK